MFFHFFGFFCWLSANLGGAATFRPLLGLPQACHLDVRGCFFLKSRGPTDPGAVFTSIYTLPNLHILFCLSFQIQFVTFYVNSLSWVKVNGALSQVCFLGTYSIFLGFSELGFFSGKYN